MADGYFNYLVGIVGGTYGKLKLLTFLYNTEFVWDYRIELDGDRAENGKMLRYNYQHDTGKRCEYGPDVPCTVLEMLVAMAIGIDRIMDEPSNPNAQRWFWEMLKNLGLDDMYDISYNQQKVIEAVGKWMNRDYDRKGRGSIFPLKKSAHIDMRKAHIWQQAGFYLNDWY